MVVIQNKFKTMEKNVDIMIYTYNLSTWVAEAGEWQVEGRSAWATE